MIDIIAVCIFFTISVIYYSYHLKNKILISRENLIVGIFALTTVSWCFIYAGLFGFISIQSEVIIMYPYFLLMFAGTESTYKLLNLHHKGLNQDFRDLQARYILCTFAAIWLNLFTILIGYLIQNIFVFMLSNLITPYYLAIMFYYNYKCLQKNKLFFKMPPIRNIYTNYFFITLSISIYEFYDYAQLFSSQVTFAPGQKDNTHFFDFFWIMINVLYFIFWPRIKYAIQEKKRGEK